MPSSALPILLLGGGALLLTSGKKKKSTTPSTRPNPVDSGGLNNLAIVRNTDIFQGKSWEEINREPLLSKWEKWVDTRWDEIMFDLFQKNPNGFSGVLYLKFRTDHAWAVAKPSVEKIARSNPEICFGVINDNGAGLKTLQTERQSF